MCCPLAFLEEFIAVFQVTMSQIDTEDYKNHKSFLLFEDFKHFSPNFRQTLSIERLKRVNKEKYVLSSMLRKEINAVLHRKLSGMDIEKDKISKKNSNFLILFTFCQNSDKLRGLQN